MIHCDKMALSDVDGEFQLNSAMDSLESTKGTSFRDGLPEKRELKYLVEEISATNQCEAEARGTSIYLAKEVDDLCKKCIGVY